MTDSMRRMVESLNAAATPLTTLPKGRPYGPEPIGHEPSRHPFRGLAWSGIAVVLIKVAVAAHAISDWFHDRANNAMSRSNKHNPKPIYAPGAWEPYRTITWGASVTPTMDPDIIGIDADGNDVRRSDVEG